MFCVSQQVTCFEYADQLLPREDPDAAKCLEGALLEDGLDIRLGKARCWLVRVCVCVCYSGRRPT